jgi:hypothetical protein
VRSVERASFVGEIFVSISWFTQERNCIAVKNVERVSDGPHVFCNTSESTVEPNHSKVSSVGRAFI